MNENPFYIKILPNWIGLTFLIIAALVSWKEYKSAQDTSRIDRSLYYAMNLNEDILGRAQSELWSITFENIDSFHSTICDQYYANPTRAQAMYSSLLIKIIDEKDLFDELLILMQFFDEVEICVNRGTCDRSTIIEVMKPSIEYLWGTFGPVFIYIDSKLAGGSDIWGIRELYWHINSSRSAELGEEQAGESIESGSPDNGICD